MALNVLVVDDSRIARMVVLKILRLASIELGEIHQAANGRQALEIINQHWIDLMFLDINMPEMTGEEVVETIRREPVWADLPIIIVSTEGSATRIDRLTGMGVRFIHKPFQPESLRKTVLEVLGGAHELQA